MRWLLAPLLLLSCDTAPCTTLGCGDEGVELTLVHEAWAAGDGTVEVTVDGTVHSCSISLPAGDVDEQYCGLEGTVLVRFSGEAGDLATIWIEGDELDALHLKIDLGGATLVDQDVPFTYDSEYPNGPGCGPECLNAAVDVTF
jgi:hypothetical protein